MGTFPCETMEPKGTRKEPNFLNQVQEIYVKDEKYGVD